MSPEDEGPLEVRLRKVPGRRPSGLRFPTWLAVPLAAGAGWVGAGWPGLIFGALAGFLIWRARR